MGRLGRFFGKIKEKAKNVVRKVSRFGKKVIQKVVPVAKKVLPLLSLAPGIVGDIASKANNALNVADNAINALPNGKMKNKLQELSGAASTKVAENSAKAADLAERVKTAGDKANQVVNAGRTLVNGAKPLVADLKRSMHVCKSGNMFKKPAVI